MENILEDYVLPEGADVQIGKAISLGDGITRYSGHDKGVRFKFYIDKVYNELKSKAAKIDIYDDVEMIQFYVDKYSKPVHIVNDKIRAKYAEEYRRFKAREAAPGTPLSKWPHISPGQISTLVSQGIFSVEQFAGLPRGAIEGKYPAVFVELHEKAERFVNSAAQNPDIQSFAGKLAEAEVAKTKMEEEMIALRERLQKVESSTRVSVVNGPAPKPPVDADEAKIDLNEVENEYNEPTKRGRGRPKKV